MQLTALLPRLSLCAVLVLNGTTAASAITMHHAAAAAADTSAACHTQGEAPKGTHHADSDCCKSGDGCQCAHAFAVPAQPCIPFVTGAHAGSMHPLSSGHHPPTLPEPIRPPIV